MLKTMFLVIMTILLTNLCTADPILRLPLVSKEFSVSIEHYNVVAESQKYTNHFVQTEGQWSNSHSSVQELPDYFVVKASISAGGRILRMSPIGTDIDGVSVLPTFTDVLTGEIFSIPFETQDGRNGINDNEKTPQGLLEHYFHYGPLAIGSDIFHVVIAYNDTLRYPTVSITWGRGSTLLNVGTIVDDFEIMSTEDPIMETTLAIRNAKDIAGLVDGLYIVIGSPKEWPDIRVETTSDFKGWSEATLQPFLIYGDVIAYRIPSNPSGFFRAIEL